ncbi:uncharacterized protein LOC135176935 isoform X2 [Pogoniulus pusillus]|uniref:uncharacterized protein LOC135176935 isoform X2 n=1 Tax=Pogoniulus pusillus TaxID=488313 RepID=UPI0030B92F5D
MLLVFISGSIRDSVAYLATVHGESLRTLFPSISLAKQRLPHTRQRGPIVLNFPGEDDPRPRRSGRADQIALGSPLLSPRRASTPGGKAPRGATPASLVPPGLAACRAAPPPALSFCMLKYTHLLYGELKAAMRLQGLAEGSCFKALRLNEAAATCCNWKRESTMFSASLNSPLSGTQGLFHNDWLLLEEDNTSMC